MQRNTLITRICKHLSINPLTPESVEFVTSPYNIHTLLSKQVMRIIKLVRHKLLLTTKFLLIITKKGVEAREEN